MRHHTRCTARPHGRALVAVLAGLLLLAACGGATQDAPGGGADAPPAEDEQTEEEEAVDDGQAPADLDEFTDLAIEAAAEEHDVAREEIEVVRAEEVDWPDGARGCPEDDEMYTQAIVPGYRVVLDVAGEQQHYHGGEGEAPFRCEDPQEPADT